jgi:hypothetical protein
MKRILRLVGDFVWIPAVLFMVGMIFFSIDPASGRSGSSWDGSGGGGGYNGDTLAVSKTDTIGPTSVASCQRIKFLAQWYGDSALVRVQTSMDLSKWYLIPALVDSGGGHDSTGFYYHKMYDRADTTGGIANSRFGIYARMLISYWGSAHGSLKYVKGAIECVH